MPIAPLERLGLGGLNTDRPNESMDLEFFDAGLDMRPYEGSLRGVPDWETANDTIRLFQNTTDGGDYPTDETSIIPSEIVQWTPAGGQDVSVLTMGETGAGVGTVYLVGNGYDPAGIVDCVTVDSFTYDQEWGFNSLVFNEIAVINPVTAQPMYSFDRQNFWTIPNWFGEATGSEITAVSEHSIYQVTTVTTDDWSSIGGSTVMVVGAVFTCTSASADITALGGVKEMHPYTAKRMTVYNGRLVALNLENDLNDGDPANDIISPIEIAYSSSVSDVGTIIDLEWYASFRNTAGNVYLTQTPGRIVDAKQLGEYLLVYKTDAVIRMQDTGEPLFVIGETAFLDDGALTYDCVADIGSNRHFVVGNYGMYIHAGGPEKDIISQEKVEKYFYSNLPDSIEDRALTFVFHDSLEKEVWVCYRDSLQSPSDTDKGCTRAMIYNYESGTFYERSLPNIRKIIETEVEGAVRIFGASSDVVPDSDSVGHLYELSSTTLVADGYVEWTSRNLGINESVKALDGLWPTSSGTFQIRVGTSDTPTPPDLAVVSPQTYNPDSMYKVDFRELGRYYTMRFQMDGTTEPDISACKTDMRIQGVR